MDLLLVQTIPGALLAHLRDRIITGEFAPGARIHENELAARLGLSKAPLREAFRILEQERLLVNLPRKGTFVTELSEADLDEVYQIRHMIETAAIDLLARKGITEVTRLGETLRAAKHLSAPVRGEDLLAFQERVTDFHTQLVMEAQNGRLNHYYQIVYFSLARYQHLNLRRNTPSTYERVLADHQCLFDFLTAGQYDAAKRLLSEHLEYARQAQKEAFRLFRETREEPARDRTVGVRR